VVGHPVRPHGSVVIGGRLFEFLGELHLRVAALCNLVDIERVLYVAAGYALANAVSKLEGPARYCAPSHRGVVAEDVGNGQPLLHDFRKLVAQSDIVDRQSFRAPAAFILVGRVDRLYLLVRVRVDTDIKVFVLLAGGLPLGMVTDPLVYCEDLFGVCIDDLMREDGYAASLEIALMKLDPVEILLAPELNSGSDRADEGPPIRAQVLVDAAQ
jgi:hypothetical protein